MDTFYAVPGAMWPGAIWPGETIATGAASVPAVIFTYGTPYFEWAAGTPYFEWAAGNPYLS